MRSALKHPQVVQKYLDAEMHTGRVLGPFHPREMKVHKSRFGVIPKKHQPGKWRLILDLLHPENHSVNAGISSELCSLTYLKLDEVAEAVITFGRGAQLAKVDVASAYWIVPVNPADRHLLGMRWKEKNLCGRSTIIQAQISAEDFYSASKCGNLGTKVVRNKIRRPLLGRLDHNR